MPKRPSSEQRLEYERDKALLLEILGFLDDLPQPSTTKVASGSPDGTITWSEVPVSAIQLAPALAAGLAQAESQGFGAARGALRIGLQDGLEMSRDLNPSEVQALNARLHAEGLATLTSARNRIWKTIPKVMVRGKIRNEAEYYLLIERLNDPADDLLSQEDLHRLFLMVAAFEERVAKRDPPAG